MCGKGGDDSEGTTLGPRGPCPQVYILTPKKKKKLQITFGSKVDNKKNLQADPWNPKIRQQEKFLK